MQPNHGIEGRTCDECGREGQPDGHAYYRHHLDALFLARQIRSERHDGRRDGTGTLQGPAGDYRDMPRDRAQHATEAEDEKSGRDHGLAPVTVRQSPKGIRKSAWVRP